MWRRNRKYLWYSILTCLAVFGLAASEHHGQVKFGGLPVPGATVTAMQGDKKLTAVTDQQGLYSFPDLADGVWTIQVEMLCFATLKQEVGIAPNAPSPEWEMKLLPLDAMKADTTKAPPAPAASGPVVASAPATAASPGAVQPTSAKANGKKTAAAPPTNAQTGFQRADVNASGDAGAASEEASLVSAAGDSNQNAADAMVVNGSVSNRVERRAIGNARKGFGSRYNGDVSFILDNSALDARAFSLTGQDTLKPAYSHARFGGSFGGPLMIPHVLRSNGQFFLNYQGTRNRNASTQSGLMPTLAMRGGDFSQVLSPLGQPVQLYDPTTRLPIPGNSIAQRISPQAQALLSLYPQPNFGGGGAYNYQIPIVGVTSQDAVQSRVNRTLNSKNFVNGNFAYQRSTTTSPNLLGFVDDAGMNGLTASGTWRHIFGQRLNTSLGYQYSRAANRTTPYFADRINVSGDAGITGNDQEPLNWGPPALNFSSGIAGISDAQQSFTRTQTSALTFSGMWMPRPHNFSFGADFRRQQFNYLSQQDPRGTFTFTGAATQAILNGVPAPGTGSDFADFLLGIPDTSSIAFGNADKYFRASMWDGFFTDDWRVSPRLTLNAGMRWEYGSPISERYGRLVNLDIAPGFTAVAPVLGSSPTGALTRQKYPASLVQPDKHGFEPRIALAWHPFLASSMVVRAGYGVYYNTSVYQSIAPQMAQQSPLSKSLSVQNSPGNPLTLANGFNASPASTPNTFAIDPSFRVGYSQNWQASVQKDVTNSTVMTLTYLGIKGTRGAQVFLPNTYPIGAANPCPTCPAGFAYLTSNGNSTREAGMIQLRRRMHNGFAGSVQYTFSRSFDDAALGGRGQGGSLIAQNWLDLSAERGPSNFDQRHLLSVQGQYTTGMGVGGGTLLRGWTGALAKGWTFVTQITAGTGLPETPVYLTAVQGTGVTGTIRPDATGVTLNPTGAGRYLNPAAFRAPAAGQWGNAGRNSIAGPAQFGLNASMARTFDRVDLRFDAYNALNHVTYPSWNTTVTSAQFGLPTTANAMRSLQATLRVRF